MANMQATKTPMPEQDPNVRNKNFKEVTLGYPTQLRRLVIGPLVNMINDMQAGGLHPMIISGYRSYSAQAIARRIYAEARPGYHSVTTGSVDAVVGVPG